MAAAGRARRRFETALAIVVAATGGCAAMLGAAHGVSTTSLPASLCGLAAAGAAARWAHLRWELRPTTPEQAATAFDRAARGAFDGPLLGSGALSVGLVRSALALEAGEGSGGVGCIDLTLHTATRAVASPLPVAPIRGPLSAALLAAIAVALTPVERGAPGDARTAPAGSGSLASDTPSLAQVALETMGLAQAPAAGAHAPATGDGAGPQANVGATGAATAGGGAAGGDAGAQGVAGGAGTTGPGRSGESGGQTGESAASTAPRPLDRPDAPPTVPEAVALLGAGRSAANDGDDPERGAESGASPRADAAAQAQDALKAGQVDAAAAGRAAAGSALDTPEAPATGDRPTEPGAQGRGVESGDDGPMVQDLDERVTWEAPGARPGAGGVNDASGTHNGRVTAEATAVLAEEQHLASQRQAGDGGVQSRTARGQAASGRAGHSAVGAGASVSDEQPIAARSVPAARTAWINAALQPAPPTAPAPTSASPSPASTPSPVETEGPPTRQETP